MNGQYERNYLLRMRQIMYDKILAHANCRVNLSRYDDDDSDDYVGSAIEIANYANGENVAVECTKCNEVIIDFNRPEKE